MCAKVVEFDSVSRRFGEQLALDNVSFQIEEGLVYGLVGSNGAGKTTIIKHLLGLLRARQGSVRVFGHDPVLKPVEVLSRIGYLSEQRDLPEWMSVRNLMWYTRCHYPGWNSDYCNELLQTFGLDSSKRVKDLSKGMRAQAVLIAAVSHHPDLLVLDEPSTGLDAVVRQDILNAIIRAVADDGRTAIFSSHLLDEVERMSDRLLMVNEGRIVLHGTVDEIRENHHLFRVRLQADADEAAEFKYLDQLLSTDGFGRNLSLVVSGEEAEVRQRLLSNQVEIIESRTATLEEVFLARAGRAITTPAEEDSACQA